MPFRPIAPADMKVLGVYTPGFEVTGGRLLFISGQAPVDAEGNTVGKGDAAAQARQTIENLRKVLRRAGGDLHHVIKVTVFTTDLAHREAINGMRTELFGAHKPASTHVQVVRLVNPDWLLEIEAVAVLD